VTRSSIQSPAEKPRDSKHNAQWEHNHTAWWKIKTLTRRTQYHLLSISFHTANFSSEQKIYGSPFWSALHSPLLCDTNHFNICQTINVTNKECIIRPPVYGSNGRTYKMLVMFSFFFFRPPFSEFPRLIALKLCHMVGICPNFIMQVQKLGGHSPQKNLRAKNMQNFGRFWITSDFDREYLRNGPTYPKSADGTNYGNSSCV